MGPALPLSSLLLMVVALLIALSVVGCDVRTMAAGWTGGYCARWDFVGVAPLPVHLFGEGGDVLLSDGNDAIQDAASPSCTPPSVAHAETSVASAWPLFFCALHAMLAASVLVRAPAVGTRWWLVMRFGMLALHIAVLCLFGSMEVMLRISSSVLTPPVDIGSVPTYYYDLLREAPASSMLAAPWGAQFVPSIALAACVIVLAIFELLMGSNATVDGGCQNQRAKPSHGTAPIKGKRGRKDKSAPK